MTSYSRFCYRMIGNNVVPLRKYFLDIKNDLQTAGLNFTLDEYLSMGVFTAILLFVLESAALSFILGLFNFNIFVSVALSITLSFSMSIMLFFVFYSYPKTVSSGRAEQIDRVLPFAVSYMSAIASGNTPPYYMFKTISRISDYGEVSREAGAIASNMKMFGMNFSDSIKRESTRTPSKNFKEILWGINTTIASGGNVKTYLREKSDLLIDEYRRKIRKYSQDLSMLVEIYLTVIIVGSIFFIVLTSIMGGEGGRSMIMIQSFIVFVFLPLMSMGFIMLIKLRSPIK
jgi:flagellar protein FlaJ